MLVRDGEELVGFTTLRVFQRDWTNGPVASSTPVTRSSTEGTGGSRFWRSTGLREWECSSESGRTFRSTGSCWSRAIARFATSRCSQVIPSTLADRTKRSQGSGGCAGAGDVPWDDYNPATGVVELRQSRGHLKPEIAYPPPGERVREGPDSSSIKSGIRARPRTGLRLRSRDAQHETAHAEAVSEWLTQRLIMPNHGGV